MHVIGLGGGKGGEIMGSVYCSGAGIQLGPIGRIAPPQSEPILKRVRGGPLIYPVDVGARQGATAGVEVGVVDGLNRRYRDVVWQYGVEAKGQVLWWTPPTIRVDRPIEAGNLGLGMNPGIGAAGDAQLYRRADNLIERLLEATLDRQLARLAGPSTVGAAVIGDRQL